MSEDEKLAKLREAYEIAMLKPAQAKLDQARDELAHQVVSPLDRVQDKDTFMKAVAAGKDVVAARDEAAIYQWDDGYGNILYLRPSVPNNQVRAISTRITAQRAAFEQLDPSISSTLSEADREPFKDHLQNEVLGKRFAELKTTSSHPS